MNKKSKRKPQPSPSKQFPWLWAFFAGAILVIAGGVFLLQQPPAETVTPAEAPQVTGAPKLVVDTDFIDEGDIAYSTPIETVFKLKNVGDQPLKILGKPQVVLMEGC